jgi:hypothetical protein
VSTGVAAIAALRYSLAAGLPLPLLPAQLLWLNVVTNGLQDVALAFEPGEQGVQKRPPRRGDEPVISRLLWERGDHRLTMAIGSFVMFTWTLGLDKTLEQARAVALTTMVLFMAFHVYSSRSERRSLFALSPLRNPFLLTATLGALTIHALALQWGAPSSSTGSNRSTPRPGCAWLRSPASSSLSKSCTSSCAKSAPTSALRRRAHDREQAPGSRPLLPHAGARGRRLTRRCKTLAGLPRHQPGFPPDARPRLHASMSELRNWKRPRRGGEERTWPSS